MNQLPLLPIILVDEQPWDRGKSADLLAIGLDEQDRRYALKTVEPSNPHLPLIEWLCYHLCNLAGIATPDFGIVTRLDKSLAFGSRWEESAKEFSPGKVTFPQFVGWLDQSKGDVAAMFALDAVMPNVDRHIGNMLFVQTGARLRALAFDWSRTRLFEPWPWPDNCKSALTWEWITSLSLADRDAVIERMERIKSITEKQVFDIMEAAPYAWRDSLDTQTAASWWSANKDSRTMQALKLLLP